MALIIATGCQTTTQIRPPNSESSEVGPRRSIDLLTVGDMITIVLKDIPNPPDPHIVSIRDDGNVSVPYIGLIAAAGKNVRELETELHSRYVPAYFRRLTVNILVDARFITVSGQVRKPGMIPHRGEMTVLEAITAAGDFTDFAKKKRVNLTRANGEIVRVNCIKAQKDPARNLPVYPGDIIEIPRRLW